MAWEFNSKSSQSVSGDSPVYPLLQRPIIECIPQYIRDTNMETLALLMKIRRYRRGEGCRASSSLEKSMFNGRCFHIMAPVAYLEGKHDGGHRYRFRETESFSPTLAHLHESAVVKSPREWPVDDAVRCLILYPMNALVADQLSRIRHMLGHRSTSKHLHDIGLAETHFGIHEPNPVSWMVRQRERRQMAQFSQQTQAQGHS